jgi:hypothetical protein
MTGTVRRSAYFYAPVAFRASNGPLPTFAFRMEFIKGDPYIRDMKNTAYVRTIPRGKCVID